MMILTFDYNYSVGNEFLGSNLCRQVIPHMSFDNKILAIFGMSDLSAER